MNASFSAREHRLVFSFQTKCMYLTRDRLMFHIIHEATEAALQIGLPQGPFIGTGILGIKGT